MTGGPARSTGALRASDAERERVVGKLEREFAAGRLSMPELEQRTGAAQDARTREQLRALTLDLPPDLVPVQATAAAPDHCLLRVFDRMSPAMERAMLALSERQSGAASARARAAAMIDASDGWPEKPPVVR